MRLCIIIAIGMRRSLNTGVYKSLALTLGVTLQKANERLRGENMRKFLALLLVVLLLVSVGCASLVPVIASFDVNPAVITAGSSTILAWSVSGAKSVTIDQGLGVLPPAGTRVVSPSITTVYTISASSALGTISKSVVVNVNQVPIIIDVNLNPPVISSGDFAALIWNVTGANSVTIDQGIGNAGASGNKLISPTTTTTYTVTANGAAGTASKSVVLTVNPPIVATMSVSPSTLAVGQSATLQWNVTGADSVTIDQGIGEVQAAGSLVVMPYTTTSYTLTATSSCCAVDKTVILTVGSPYPFGFKPGYAADGYPYTYPYGYSYGNLSGYPYIDIFTGSPSTIQSGQSAVLHWYVTGATSVSITGIGNVSSSDSIVVLPASTTTYVLTASNSYGSRSRSITIKVM